MDQLLQKGFNTLGIDIFMIAYHTWLYHRLGISIQTTWSNLGLSCINFFLLRQLIIWGLPFISFNAEFTNNTIAVLLQVAFFYFVQEIYMYFIHRLMHKIKFLYIWIHRRHHLAKAECFTTAMYMSPLEIILHIYPDLMLGPVILYNYCGYIYKEAFTIWTCLATFYFIWSHSGVTDSLYMPSSKDHWLHHKYYNVNYGSGLLDRIFGTALYEDR